MNDHEYSVDTLAIRAGGLRTPFNEHSEALFATVSFVHESAEMAAKRFTGEEPGYIYSRFTNPTVDMFERRLAAMEGAEAAIATSTGMAAISTLAMTLCSAGDHIVTSGSVFGSTLNVFGAPVMGKFGVTCEVVNSTTLDAWAKAIRPGTKLVFLETPSNPMADVFDIAAIADMARKVGATFAVDNCFCTPVLQRPISLGADVVIHSASKHLDGQGRVMGGAIVGTKEMCRERVYNFLRTTGASLAPFNAWVILKGMETLPIRMRAHSENALALAQWLEAHPKVANVNYPFLVSHPAVALAKRQQSGGGAVLSFNVKGGKAEAWKVVDAVKIMSITGNLGDVKTTITHPATTTHGRMTQAARDAAGIGDALIRVAVGLESQDDLRADLARGLSHI
ncbi:MAG: O-succinylhomoserine sulfhydrylase [Burkholderiales bacterium]|nr:O-succinylhomoserine sulfhydrylase [Burkholderiales bacterium]